MMCYRLTICIAILLGLTLTARCHTEHLDTDRDKLNKAIEYFQSGKYHESLLLFEKLDDKYQLNIRFRAYKGVCYYYDLEYEKAAITLDEIIDKIDVFAPHERSVYYYCGAESHFKLKEYVEAIVLFEKYLLLCYDNEKGDALFKIGLCYKQLGQIETAQEYLVRSLDYYRKFNDTMKLNIAVKELNK